jgi:hypothetical protein
MIPDALQLYFTKKNKRKTLLYKEKEKEQRGGYYWKKNIRMNYKE